MATATEIGRPTRRAARRASAEPRSSAIEFRIFEDNGGGYQWTIVDSAGERLVRSGSFGSYDDAENAARLVRDNANVARLERRAPDDPLDGSGAGENRP